MLPLIQQMQADVRNGTLSSDVFGEDLEQVQKSLQLCRRIFGGMLTFSRNAARRSGYAQVRRALETASAILKYGMLFWPFVRLRMCASSTSPTTGPLT